MQLLVNHQLNPITIQPKSLKVQTLRYCCNFTALSSFLVDRKQKPKTNLKNCYQCNVSIEISLDLKVCFFSSKVLK